MMYQLNFFNFFNISCQQFVNALFSFYVFLFFQAYLEKTLNEVRRCRRWQGMKLSAIGEGAQ